MNNWWSAHLIGSQQSKRSNRAHRVAVTEDPPTPDALPDYADAFEVSRSPADHRSAEQWARDGFERLPVVTRRPLLFIHRWILGFRVGPWVSANHIVGWRIVASERELMHLEARGRLMRGHMVWRLHPDRLVMTTFLQFEKRRTASAVWAVIGNIHRGGAPYLFGLAADHRP